MIDGVTEWILNTSTGNGEAYTEPDQNTPGEEITGVSLTPDGLHDGEPRTTRRMVGR